MLYITNKTECFNFKSSCTYIGEALKRTLVHSGEVATATYVCTTVKIYCKGLIISFSSTCP